MGGEMLVVLKVIKVIIRECTSAFLRLDLSVISFHRALFGREPEKNIFQWRVEWRSWSGSDWSRRTCDNGGANCSQLRQT